jgi:hypothetical protein
MMSRNTCSQCGKDFLNAQALGSHARWCKGAGHVARMCTNCGMDPAGFSPTGHGNHARWCGGIQPTEDPPLGLPSDTGTMDDGSSEDVDATDERQTVLEHQPHPTS